MLVAQITDAHVGVPGVALFDGYDPAVAVARVVARLNALAPRPDIVLFTGDLTETGTAAEYVHLAALLAPLELPVAAIPGNHDRRGAFVAALAGTAVRIGGGGHFLNLVIEDFALRLVGLDTVAGEGAGLLCAERLGWLEARLAEAPGWPTLIFMHHPPFATGIAAMDAIGCANGAGLAEVLARHPQVRRVICGHAHRAVHRDWAGRVASVCPSIAYPLALDFDPGAPLRLVPQPPGYQLHRFEAAGGIVTHTDFLP